MKPSELQCIASTIGFEHASWAPDYYPDNCPLEWRLAYFMNDFRAVYLPFEAWYNNAAGVRAIAQELEAGFELLIGWPPSALLSSVGAALNQLAQLKVSIRSVVVDCAGRDRAFCLACADEIGQHYAVAFDHLDFEAGADEPKIDAEQSIVWRPAETDEPHVKGALLIVILPCQSLRELKLILDKLQSAAHSGTFIRLLFEPGAQSARRAMETRSLIELMGLA